MTLLESLITWIHLTSASIWVGGSIFIGIVLVPMLKTLANTIEERTALMITIGKRFNKVALPALMVLVATGLYKAHLFLASPSTLLDSNYGIILAIKIIIVSSMITLFGMHVKISGYGNEKHVIKQDSRIIRLRTRIIWLGRIIVAQSIVILLFAALLDSGI
ncbi:MAG: CopD family protein [Nitrososphaerales archaeon]